MNIGIQEFLDAVFDPETLPKDQRICLCLGEGGTKNVSGTAQNIKKIPIGIGEIYFCLSTVVVPGSHGARLRRRAEDIRLAHLIVFDDIGTKCSSPPVEPSYKLQTSIKEGTPNFQWGYFITPLDVSDANNRAYFDACLVAAAQAGWNDPGLRSASRIVRAPGALHTKSGFVATITDWHPERVWDLPALMAELGLDPDRLQAASQPPMRTGAANSLTDISDPIYNWLNTKALVIGPSGSDFINIVCPWADSHSDGRVEAGYSPLDYGAQGRQFKCLHGHCADRDTAEFLQWVEDQGGPTPDGLPLTAQEQSVFASVFNSMRDVRWSTKTAITSQSRAISNANNQISGVVQDQLERFAYSAIQQTWIDTQTGHYANANTLRVYIGRDMPLNRRGKRQPPDELWWENANRLIVADKIWFPGAPKGVVQFLDSSYWNTYEPYQPASHHDPAICKLFHDHIIDTFGPDGALLEQWLGWAAQHPEQKILWAPLLVGVQGDGKSLLADALGLAVGPQRLHKSSTTAISGNFNEFLDGKFVLAIEELRVSGQNRYTILDKLKDIITNPSIEIRPKGLANRTAPNFCNVIAMTNHLDALPIDASDRRWGIFTSRFIVGNGDLESERIDTGYFNSLMDALRYDPEAVVGWLYSIDLTGFDPTRRPPMTHAKASMISDATSEHDIAVLDLIRGRGGVGITPHAVSMPALRAQLRILGLDDEPNRISAILRNAGFNRGINGVRVNGEFVRVWYDVKHYGHLSKDKMLLAAKTDLEENNARYAGVLPKPVN